MNSGLNGKNKKGRPVIPQRGSRGRMDRPLMYEGAYNNHRVLQAMGSLVGYQAVVQTKNKETFEGILSSMSPKFEIVLDLPHNIINGSDSSIIGSLDMSKKKMIFKREDIVNIDIKAITVDSANKESFATDSAISNKLNGQLKSSRPLEPWENDDHEVADNMELEENGLGWTAQDMFKRNEEIYGVQTTYKPDMEGYTTPLPKRDTKEWKDHEVQAQKIAHEIEISTTSLATAELENGQTEEERFSSVSKYAMPRRRTYNKPTRVPHSSGQQGGPNYSRYNEPPIRPDSSYGGAQNNVPYEASRVPVTSIPQPPPVTEESEHEESCEEEVTGQELKQTPTNYERPHERRRFSREDQIVDLKKFGQSFNLTEANVEKPALQTRCPPPRQLATAPPTRPAAVPPQPTDQACGSQSAVRLQSHEITQNEDIITPPTEEKNTPPVKPRKQLNPDAEPFTPRAVATPPPLQSSPQVIAGGHPHMGPIFNQSNVVPAYLVPQMNLSARNIQKRGAVVGHQRPDYASQIQVANATGTPLLSQGPIANLPVQIPQQIIPPNQYQQMPFMLRYQTPIAMMPSPGVYPTAEQGQHMFMSPGLMHHPALSAQHPAQANSLQNHNAGPLAGHAIQPNPAVASLQSSSQTGVYGGQALAAHLPPHVSLPGQSPHGSQYAGHGALAAHHQPTVLMVPQQIQAQHFAAANSPHSAAAQIPVSQQYNNSIVHYNHGPPVNYLPGPHSNQVTLHHPQ